MHFDFINLNVQSFHVENNANEWNDTIQANLSMHNIWHVMGHQRNLHSNLALMHRLDSIGSLDNLDGLENMSIGLAMNSQSHYH